MSNWWDFFTCADSRGPCCPGPMDHLDPRARPNTRPVNAFGPNSNDGMWTELIESCGPCGVGITFKYIPAIEFFQVQSLVPEGPALLSGQVYTGDILVNVDGQSAKGIPLTDLARMMIGPAGSTIMLTFHRQVSGSTGGMSTPTSSPSPPKLQELSVVLTRQVVHNSPRLNVSRHGSQASSLTSSPAHGISPFPAGGPRLGHNLKAGPSFVNSGGQNGASVHVHGSPLVYTSPTVYTSPKSRPGLDPSMALV